MANNPTIQVLLAIMAIILPSRLHASFISQRPLLRRLPLPPSSAHYHHHQHHHQQQDLVDLQPGCVPRSWPRPEEVVVMPRHEWEEAASRHRQRVLALLGRAPGSSITPTITSRTSTTTTTSSSRHHPIYGFLYEYYHFKPSTLLSWTPGLLPSPILLHDALPPYPTTTTTRRGDSGVSVLRARGGVGVRLISGPGEAAVVGTMYIPLGDNGGVPPSPASRHREALEEGRDIMRASLNRPPGLHCFSVHEWALVYWRGGELGPKGLGQGPGGGLGQGPGRADRVGPRGGPRGAAGQAAAAMHTPPHPRVLYEDVNAYQSLPLRVTQAEMNAVVESRVPLQCTHWDAMRFFTPEAMVLVNGGGGGGGGGGGRQRLGAENKAEFEQPGCIHTNGDLLKWALKLGPFCPSSLAADCLDLAIEARVVDMRAAPYDLSFLPILYSGIDLGLSLEPIRVETPEGRREYQQHQLRLYDQAQPLRRALLDVYDRLLSTSWPTGDEINMPRVSGGEGKEVQ